MHIVVLLFDSVDYHMVMSLYVVVMCSGKWNTIQTLTLWIHLQMSAGGYKVVTFHFVEKKKVENKKLLSRNSVGFVL